MTRTGKIARLSLATREQLNRRIADGHMGRDILAWLNDLPEVQSLLATDFEGRPINHVNLHEWKEGGYREWLLQQEAIAQAAELAATAGNLANAASGHLSDHLAAVIIARYATEFSNWTGEDDPKLVARLNILRVFCHDIAELRRGEHEAARIRIEETYLERARQQLETDILHYFRRWAAFPKIREALTTGDPIPKDEPDPLLSIFSTEPPPRAHSDPSYSPRHGKAEPTEPDPLNPPSQTP